MAEKTILVARRLKWPCQSQSAKGGWHAVLSTIYYHKIHTEWVQKGIYSLYPSIFVIANNFAITLFLSIQAVFPASRCVLPHFPEYVKTVRGKQNHWSSRNRQLLPWARGQNNWGQNNWGQRNNWGQIIGVRVKLDAYPNPPAELCVRPYVNNLACFK